MLSSAASSRSFCSRSRFCAVRRSVTSSSVVTQPPSRIGCTHQLVHAAVAALEDIGLGFALAHLLAHSRGHFLRITEELAGRLAVSHDVGKRAIGQEFLRDVDHLGVTAG